MKQLLSRRSLFAAGSFTTLAIAGGVFALHGLPGVYEPALYMCKGWPMTPAQVAAHRGIDLDTFEQIHAKRSVDMSQLCDMPQKRLQRAIYRAAHPKPDRPGE